MNPSEAEKNQLRFLIFLLLSVIIGIIAGLGAVVFRGLIALFHNLFFLGYFSVSYNANTYTPASPWGPLVIFVPMAGAVGVAFLVKNFAPEAKGHGVPEVMEAIYYQKGVIRPVVAFFKALASALSIGSGGSVGREGPIIQIASAFGSTVGQILKMGTYERTILIAAGAGGGIAATFNTPVGGMLFAVELLLQEVSVKTLVPVAVTTVTATYVGRIFFGTHPSFVIPALETHYFQIASPLVLLGYAGLGAITGLASSLFIRSIYSFEEFFDLRIKGGYYVRHLMGMLLVGIIIYVSMGLWGHYYVEGVGYATIQEILSGTVFPFYLLVILFFLKLVATSLTLGSGGSGGIFSPSLFLGATLGEAFGIVFSRLFPQFPVNPEAFAVAGMAGLFGGSTGAALTSIVMIFEMTLDYSVILPMTITAAISYGIRKLFTPESIYIQKLVRRGHAIPDALRASFIHYERARDIMDKKFIILPAWQTFEFARQEGSRDTAINNFIIEDNGLIIGMAPQGDIIATLEAGGDSGVLRNITRRNFLTVDENTPVLKLFVSMFSDGISFVLVLSDKEKPSAKNVLGVITRERLMEFIREAEEQFSA